MIDYKTKNIFGENTLDIQTYLDRSLESMDLAYLSLGINEEDLELGRRLAT